VFLRGSADWVIRETARVAVEKNAFPVVSADEPLEVSVIFFRNLSQFLPLVYAESTNM
jgi:hypothetical protein